MPRIFYLIFFLSATAMGGAGPRIETMAGCLRAISNFYHYLDKERFLFTASINDPPISFFGTHRNQQGIVQVQSFGGRFEMLFIPLPKEPTGTIRTVKESKSGRPTKEVRDVFFLKWKSRSGIQYAAYENKNSKPADLFVTLFPDHFYYEYLKDFGATFKKIMKENKQFTLVNATPLLRGKAIQYLEAFLVEEFNRVLSTMLNQAKKDSGIRGTLWRSRERINRLVSTCMDVKSQPIKTQVKRVQLFFLRSQENSDWAVRGASRRVIKSNRTRGSIEDLVEALKGKDGNDGDSHQPVTPASGPPPSATPPTSAPHHRK